MIRINTFSIGFGMERTELIVIQDEIKSYMIDLNEEIT